MDFGAQQGETVPYPRVAFAVAEAVARGDFERAILCCGTGIGMAICANKVPGVRAAVCHDAYSAERARKSNDAQVRGRAATLRKEAGCGASQPRGRTTRRLYERLGFAAVGVSMVKKVRRPQP